MAGGVRGSCALCLFECVATDSHVPPAEGCDSFCELLGHLKVAIYKYLAVLLHNVFRCVYCYIE